MAYTKNPTWVDGEGGGTRIDAADLQNIEDGLFAAAATADGAIPKTLIDAKGDLLAGTGADIITRLALGASGASLVADSTQATGLRWTTAYRLEGSGIPEGAVAAPIGSTYTDSAATTGAVLWIKTSGTGTTGWVVTQGDTGWRNVSSLLTTGLAASSLAGQVKMRRIGRLVELHFKLDVTASSISKVMAGDWPAGFNAPGGYTYGSFRYSSAGTGQGLSALTSIDTWSWASAASDGLKTAVARPLPNPGTVIFDIALTTDDAWPTTLPGTAA